MFRRIYQFFDKLEDDVRGSLSRFPLLYAFIGGTAIVLFWRGIWHAADLIELSPGASILIGAIVLLLTGLLTASFIGDHIIISGLKHDKKIGEVEREVRTEEDVLLEIRKDIEEIKKKLR